VITGASGYVGGRLVPTLLRQGWNVLALSRDPAPWLEAPQITCDLAAAGAAAALAEAFATADAVIHLAGEDEVLAAEQPAAALSSTVVATERVAEACVAAAVMRLIYMSTVHVYGARMEPDAVLCEDARVEPRSAYAISRLASEHVAAALAAQAYDLVVFRLTNAVGAPAEPTVSRWTLVANDLCRQGALHGTLRLKSSGTQWRDFVSLGEVCSGLVRAISPGTDPLPPGTYNLGSGEPTSVRALAGLIQDGFERETGVRPPLEAPDPEPDPPRPYRVSVSRAAEHGLKLQANLEPAVTETVRFCLEHREALGG